MIQQGVPIVTSQLWDSINAYWARFLDCSVADLHGGGNKIIYSNSSPGLFSLNIGISRVFSVKPEVKVPEHAAVLSREEIYQAIAPLGAVEEIYESGIVMYCPCENFRPADELDCETIPYGLADERYGAFAAQVGWKDDYRSFTGPASNVFGIFRDGKLVSAVTIKIWDDIIGAVRVATLPNYRGRGYARAVVSAATRWILYYTSLIPQYDTEIHNIASQKLGLSIGFQPYGMISYGKLADGLNQAGEHMPDAGCACAPTTL